MLVYRNNCGALTPLQILAQCHSFNPLTHWHTTFYNTWRTYIYIYIYIYIYGASILDVSRSHTTTQQSR